MRRPSPALVVAVLALVVACAGTATAATLITGREIRNDSVTGADIRDRSLRGRDIGSNTVTGRNVNGLSGRDVIPNGLDGSDIDEDTLDTVPSAARSNTAAVADALAHATVRGVYYNNRAGTPATTVIDEGQVRVTAECSPAGRLSATVVPTGTGAGPLRITVTHPGTPATTNLVTDNAFVSGDSASLVAGGAANASGTMIFRAGSGEVLTFQYLAHELDDCTLMGNLVRTTP
jgi:hypothetical protein